MPKAITYNLDLLFGLFVRGAFPAPFAVLLELDFLRDKLPVLARPIVGATALRTRELYELVLRHRAALYRRGL